MLTMIGLIKEPFLLEPEAVLQKAQYICGKTFYLEPVLNMYKKAVIHEDPITSKILEKIEKGDIYRIDFGCKKITNDYSHMIISNEDKYQSYIKLEAKTKMVYNEKLYKYGDMVGLRYYYFQEIPRSSGRLKNHIEISSSNPKYMENTPEGRLRLYYSCLCSSSLCFSYVFYCLLQRLFSRFAI